MEFKKKILQLPRRQKQVIVLLADIILSLLATWLAFTFRLDQWHFPNGNEWIPYILGSILFIPFFIQAGLYRAIFRYSGISNFASVARAVALYGATLFLILLVGSFQSVPRSVGISQPILFFCFIFGLRLSAALFLEKASSTTGALHNVLIYGAGEAGAQASGSLGMTPSYRVVGFLDEAVAKHGRRIHGITIFSPKEAKDIVKRFNVTDILIAVPSASTERRRQIINSLLDLHVRVRTIPGIVDLARGIDTLADGKELNVIDLLDREPIKNTLNADLIEGRTVLVTGAGGSIGAELCRQILSLNPSVLTLLDHSEFNLYTIDEELRIIANRRGLKTEICPCLASVKDEVRIEAVFKRYAPAMVFHAAAYKHVPLVEDNPFEAAANNVFGTLIVAEAAKRHKVERFTLISTDKAVRPTNYMGASKRLAEQIVQALAILPGHSTIFSMVRFGNVLGSSGSVIPLFRKQISKGGPITITHPDVVRYFMTIPEAVGLVLQAAQMAKGGEVFVLDMGQPVKIINLAKKMIRLAGFTERTEINPHGEIGIITIGLRPGEKLYEELLIGDNPQETENPHIMMAHEVFTPWPELSKQIKMLQSAVEGENLQLLNSILPRVTPREVD
jgi:FlaA1/EpsC-like NDP-sugar epimerase